MTPSNSNVLLNPLNLIVGFDGCKSEIQKLPTPELKQLEHFWFGKDGDELLNALKISNWVSFELGVRQGWWKNWNENGPIPFTNKFKLSDFPENATTANLVHKLGMFPSLTQARKNGFNEPLTTGEFSFKKGMLKAIITD